MKRLFTTFLLLASISVYTGAIAGADGRAVSATCTVCHGSDNISRNRDIPTLVGLDKKTILSKTDIMRLEGTGVMGTLINGYTQDEIEAAADHISQKSLSGRVAQIKKK